MAKKVTLKAKAKVTNSKGKKGSTSASKEKIGIKVGAAVKPIQMEDSRYKAGLLTAKILAKTSKK